MTKMSLKHVETLSAAKLNMIRLADGSNEPRFKKRIEDMVERLGEVLIFVLDTIYQPELPLNYKGKGDGSETGQD